MKDSDLVFFSFRLTAPLDCSKQCFGIQVSQQGPRLLHYRDPSNKFEPSKFSIMLMTESGEYIRGYSEHDFNNCMYSLDLKTVLPAGNYIVAVNAIWNDSTSKDKAYKDIVLDIYYPGKLQIQSVGKDYGLQILAKSLATLAKSQG
jgi:hypothetical protein